MKFQLSANISLGKMATSPRFDPRRFGKVAVNSDLDESNCEIEFSSRSFVGSAGDESGIAAPRNKMTPKMGQGELRQSRAGDLNQLQEQGQQQQPSTPKSAFAGSAGDTCTLRRRQHMDFSGDDLESSPPSPTELGSIGGISVHHQKRLPASAVPDRFINDEHVLDLTSRVRLSDDGPGGGGPGGDATLGEYSRSLEKKGWRRTRQVAGMAISFVGFLVEAAVIGVLFYLLIYKT